MVAIILSAILIVFVFFSSPIYAKNYGSTLCNDPQFFCYLVKKGETWDKLFNDPNQKDLVMRVNRMNTRLHAGMKIAVPKHMNTTNIMDFSPMPKQIDPPGEKLILVSIQNLAFGAYEADGTLEHWGPISAGRNYCPDIGRGCRTGLGNFSIHEKRGAGCVSTKFPVGRGGAPMPYCMFFHGGYALHGSYEVPGYNDSHGCIRLFVDDAKWLNQVFTDGEHTRVIVRNSI